MMWISVDGGSGQMHAGQTALQFTLSERSAEPDPRRLQESIIFRHDMMANKFFKVGGSRLPSDQLWLR